MPVKQASPPPGRRAIAGCGPVRCVFVGKRAFGRVQFRSLDEVRALFCGLELVEPGLVPVPDWRPDGDGTGTGPAAGEAGEAGEAGDKLQALGLACAGVARKP